MVEPGGTLAARRYPWPRCEWQPPDAITLNNSVEYLPNTYHRRGEEGAGAKNTAEGRQTVAELERSTVTVQGGYSGINVTVGGGGGV